MDLTRRPGPSDRAEPTAAGGAFLLVTVCSLSIWTITALLIPDLRFTFFAPRLQPALTALSVFAAALAAAVASVRFFVARAPAWLFLALGFQLLAINRIVFEALTMPSDPSDERSTYAWLAGRLAVGVLLLLGAFWPRAPIADPRRAYARWTFGTLAALGALHVALVWLAGSHPGLVGGTAPGASTPGIVGRGLTAVDLALGLTGAAVFLLAAQGYARNPQLDRHVRTWLPTVLAIAAYSHLHYMLEPTVFSDRVSTGDILRAATSLFLLLGLLDDVRRTYVTSGVQAGRLRAVDETERRQVRQIEDVDRATVDLVRILSHELMHPVAAIRTLALALRRGWTSMDDDTRERALDGLVHQSAQLGDLAERAPSLMDLRPGAGGLVSETVLVVDLLDQVARTSSQLGGRLRVSDATDGGIVAVDRVRVVQVFHNLLANAVKFSSPKAPIDVEASRRNGHVVFTVRDQGIGISRADEGRLFEPFSRIRHDDEPVPDGTGLGLYISRLIVEGHGGRIWIDRRSGPGTAFSFSIPTVGTGR